MQIFKKKKKRTNRENLNSVFEKMEDKTRDAMGPIAKSWKILVEAKQSEDETLQISVHFFFMLIK